MKDRERQDNQISDCVSLGHRTALEFCALIWLGILKFTK